MPSYGITVKPSLLDVPKATSAAADGISGASFSNASSEMSVDGWDGIALEYSIEWPLHLFFTQEVLSK
jgi:gamma-tubulin complex component 4